MLRVPAARLAVLQLAVFELALPVGSATVPQPVIGVPSAIKAMLPAGAPPVTVAVNVTLVPAVDGLAELASVVVVEAKLLEISVTASMKVVLSAESVLVKAIVCVPLLATENDRLMVAKLVLAGDTRLPICVPSTVTRTGWICPLRCAALNERV